MEIAALIANHDALMQLALDEAAAALAAGDEPYGSVVVRNGDVVTGRNQCLTAVDPTAHSEVMAIRNAATRWGTTDLSSATLYCSFEPCPMCCGAIILSGIRTVLIGAGTTSALTLDRLLQLSSEAPSITIRRDILSAQARAFYAGLAPN
jgi:tRNA(adenine34) deaminase